MDTETKIDSVESWVNSLESAARDKQVRREPLPISSLHLARSSRGLEEGRDTVSGSLCSHLAVPGRSSRR